MVHGMQDLNVRTRHAGQWWDALARHGVERKIWLSQTGHVDPFDYRRGEWVTTLHHWFDHYLMGYDNGIDRAPMADIERAPGTWSTDPPLARSRHRAPPPCVRRRAPHPASAHWAPSAHRRARPRRSPTTRSSARPTGRPGSMPPTPAKAGFRTGPLTAPLRLSGSGKVTVTVTPSTSTAHLSAVLVDLGPDTIRNYAADGEGITTLDSAPAGEPEPRATPAASRRPPPTPRRSRHTVFSRGWADLGNYADAHQGRPLTPGKPYTITLDLAASDHVVPAGHRLALIVAGTDAGLIDPPSSKPQLTLDLSRTSAQLPLTGGAPALGTGHRPGAPRTPATAHPLDGIAPPRSLSGCRPLGRPPRPPHPRAAPPRPPSPAPSPKGGTPS